MNLGREFESKPFLFRHVVQQNDSVFGRIGFHFLEIDFFNREKNFGAYLTDHASLEGYYLLLFSKAIFKHVSRQNKLDKLDLLVEVIYVN